MNLLKMAMAAKMGGAKSYNDLEDKPFGEFDSPDNVVDIHFDPNGWYASLNPDEESYFVSDRVFTKEELLSSGSPFYMEVRTADGNNVKVTVELAKADFYDGGSFIRFSTLTEAPWGGSAIARIHVVYDCETAYFFESDMPAPQNGIYFSYSTYCDTRVERLYRDGKGIKTIDNKYLDLENHPVIKDILSKI